MFIYIFPKCFFVTLLIIFFSRPENFSFVNLDMMNIMLATVVMVGPTECFEPKVTKYSLASLVKPISNHNVFL